LARRCPEGAILTRVLVFSSLYPNAAQPNHGVFVENRLRHTLALGGLEAVVVAPVPYFPFRHPRFGRYAAFARSPRSETRHGVEVLHPRYLVVPKVGAALAPEFLYRSALSTVRQLEREGRKFDVIDAHYFYPDGVAAARLGRTLRLPVVITGRGTDLTLIPNDPVARRQIQAAAAEASAMVTVCDDLRTRLIDLGADEARALVLRNGVELSLFKLADKAPLRAALGLEGFTLISVGGLIPRKGHGLVIEALRECADCTLMIAGGGPMRGELEALARELGVADRVRFLGEVPHDQLPRYYGAADVMVLASEREGWANVLLESMACGTPVLASNVNGTSEVVQGPEAGLLLPERTPGAIATSLAQLRANMPDRAATRRYAEQFDWLQIASANKALLEAAAKAGYADRHSRDIVGNARRALSVSAVGV
jgi:teichuronic acid biosynthesis glycosyltransferase TuaC